MITRAFPRHFHFFLLSHVIFHVSRCMGIHVSCQWTQNHTFLHLAFPLLSKTSSPSTMSSSVPAVISMHMSSRLHYPDYDWARFVSGLPFQYHLVIRKATFRFSAVQMLAGVTLQVINLWCYCVFDFGIQDEHYSGFMVGREE